MVVLLFTDVEASTRSWERYPVEMRAAHVLHDEMLRTEVGSKGGDVVKSTGDGLLATFSSVVACIAACLDMQRALEAASWELPEPLRVRMGVHVGEAERRAGDLYGTAVNRAARITAVGHGGQVLISARAAGLAEGALPPGVTLRDLGAHRLKDLTHPEHLYQLMHRDLEMDFPPLATIDVRPNNLPMQVSEFFGRDAELAAVRGLLEDPGVRLVTLSGPGGTGKTRLALQLAAELADRYRDGLFFVDLSAERDIDSAFAVAGQPQRALDLVEEAVVASGSDDAVFPEFRALRGDIISMLPGGDPTGAEASYRAAVRGARMSGSRLTELSAGTRLVGLLRAQGRSPEESRALRALYETFTEGFDEPELVEARAVLGLGPAATA